MPPSERLAWTAGVVAPSPSDRVLEVGCGHGVLVSLLTDRLTTGVVVAVDRSATMVAAAARRNRQAIDAGQVFLHQATLTEADLGGQVFDVVVAVNVRAFWTPPGPEWDVVGRVLARDGRVIVAWSVMSEEAQASVEGAVRRLAGARGLVVVGLRRGRTATMDSVAVDLRRS